MLILFKLRHLLKWDTVFWKKNIANVYWKTKVLVYIEKNIQIWKNNMNTDFFESNLLS